MRVRERSHPHNFYYSILLYKCSILFLVIVVDLLLHLIYNHRYVHTGKNIMYIGYSTYSILSMVSSTHWRGVLKHIPPIDKRGLLRFMIYNETELGERRKGVREWKREENWKEGRRTGKRKHSRKYLKSTHFIIL